MNIREKDISVIVPVFNGEKTIINTLQSICQQTAKEYIKQIIIIDDGSTDMTAQIIAEYSKQVDIDIRLYSFINGGVSKARNQGIKRAEGSWIALCDADDTWLSQKLEKQIELINTYDNIDFLGGNHTNYVQKILWKKIDKLTKLNVYDLSIKMLPQTSTAIFKKAVIEKAGIYDENQYYAEDGNFFMRIAANHNYYYYPEQVVYYGNGKRGFGDSGLSANIEEMHKGIIKNIKEMKSLKYYGFCFYLLSIVFENIKYYRRKWILKYAKKNNNLYK